jgi:hypothetical protein
MKTGRIASRPWRAAARQEHGQAECFALSVASRQAGADNHHISLRRRQRSRNIGVVLLGCARCEDFRLAVGRRGRLFVSLRHFTTQNNRSEITK